MQALSTDQRALYNEAVTICTRMKRDEGLLIAVLQKIERTKLFKKFQYTSLFQFAVHELGLSEPVAYGYISVERAACRIPVLKAAVDSGRLSVSKASRVVSALTSENAGELVEFAIKNSWEKINREVARINPQARAQDKVKHVSDALVQVTITLSIADFENLKRAEALAAQKGKKLTGRGDVVGMALAGYVERHDPVLRARRAAARKVIIAKKKSVQRGRDAGIRDAAIHEAIMVREMDAPAQVEPVAESLLCVHRATTNERIRLTAEQKNMVLSRDQGRCTHININDQRCDSDRYLHVHHIVPVSVGGSNDPENLVTLCSAHHDLVHQLSLPLETQITWLRSPSTRYLNASLLL